MTTKSDDQASAEKENGLLSAEEQAILSHIASQESPYSQRAQALLAIDEGATQSEAGRQTGLTPGQVRYWLVKFRKDRTSIFPQELLDPAEPITSPDMPDLKPAEGEEEGQQELPDAKETAESTEDVAAMPKESPKTKMKPKKKSKKTKKVKKPKKDKKAKKEEKPEKKAKKKKRKKTKKRTKSKKVTKKKKRKKTKKKSKK